MQPITRYAVYYAPRPGNFADQAAAWLGRDPISGATLTQPALDGVPDPHAITADPRRYGFHGTLRAPFRPADGMSQAQIEAHVADLATQLAPVICDGLLLENLQGFLALTPLGCEAALLDLASRVVDGTDPLRAPLTEAEIARRRPEQLTPRQKELLARWGYPYVMEEFRFHLTLTERLPAEQAAPVFDALAQHFAPVLPQPFMIEDLCLFKEVASGPFQLLHRYALTG
jgi:putative phosphonate metabolism protein